MLKAPASRAEDPRFESRMCRDFSGVELYQWFNIGTPVATLPGAWRYRVSDGTGRPGVSILWLGEMESWICSFYLSVAARKNCPSRSVPEIHLHVAGTLSNKQLLFYSVLGCGLPLQEVALRQRPPSFSVLCYPCPYRSLLPHSVTPPTTFWSSNWSYTLYLPLCASNSPSIIFHLGDVSSPFPFRVLLQKNV